MRLSRAACAIGICTALAACDFTGGKGASSNAASDNSSATAAAAGGSGTTAAATGNTTASASITPMRPSGTTINNPSNQDVLFLYYSLIGQPPPLDDWATKDAGQTTSDEFAKARKAAEIKAEYQKKIASMTPVGKLLVDMNAQLGEYDGKSGEFPVQGLGSSNYLSYYYNGSTVKVTFVNGETASHWRLSASDAEAAFKRNLSSHGVTLEMELQIVGVDPAADGGTIRARVLGYKVRGYNQQQLGAVAL